MMPNISVRAATAARTATTEADPDIFRKQYTPTTESASSLRQLSVAETTPPGMTPETGGRSSCYRKFWSVFHDFSGQRSRHRVLGLYVTTVKHSCQLICRPSLYSRDTRLSACIDDVHRWMHSNRLQLNSSKSELIWCATAHRQHQLPRDLLGLDLTPRFVDSCTWPCNLQWYQGPQHADLCSADCLSSPASVAWCQTICSNVHQPVSGRCPCTVAARLRKCYSGCPPSLRTQPSPVRSEPRSSVDARITSPTLLSVFYWLRAKERIKFKLVVIVYHGTAPRFPDVADKPAHHGERSANK